jgi:hypothetical protein
LILFVGLLACLPAGREFPSGLGRMFNFGMARLTQNRLR